MKATELVCKLVKQIELHGNREVKFVGNKGELMQIDLDTEYNILSVTKPEKEVFIEIYGE